MATIKQKRATVASLNALAAAAGVVVGQVYLLTDQGRLAVGLTPTTYAPHARLDDLDGKQAALGFTPENVANKGVANGYAGLGADGKVPSAQLPAPPTVPVKATGAEVRAGTNDAKFVTAKALQDAFATVAVAASGAFALDGNAGLNFAVTLSAAATMNVPTNMADGDSGVIYFIQDATGGRTLALHASIRKFGAYTLSTAANAIDRCGYYYRSGVLELTALEKGLA